MCVLPHVLFLKFIICSPSSCFRDTRKGSLNDIEVLGSELIAASFIFTPTLAQKQGIKLQGNCLLHFTVQQDGFLRALSHWPSFLLQPFLHNCGAGSGSHMALMANISCYGFWCPHGIEPKNSHNPNAGTLFSTQAGQASFPIRGLEINFSLHIIYIYNRKATGLKTATFRHLFLLIIFSKIYRVNNKQKEVSK